MTTYIFHATSTINKFWNIMLHNEKMFNQWAKNDHCPQTQQVCTPHKLHHERGGEPSKFKRKKNINTYGPLF